MSNRISCPANFSDIFFQETVPVVHRVGRRRRQKRDGREGLPMLGELQAGETGRHRKLLLQRGKKPQDFQLQRRKTADLQMRGGREDDQFGPGGDGLSERER